MEPNQISNTSPKPKFNLWLITTIILAVLLIAGGAVFAWQKSDSNKIKNDLQSQINTLQNQIQQLTATATTPTDETAGWKTYANKQYGFEIKYPPEALLMEGSKFNVTNRVSSVSGYASSFVAGHESDDWDFSVDVIEVSPGISFQQYWEKNLKCNPGESLCFDPPFSAYKESVVGGRPAFKTGVPFGGEGELNVSRTAYYILKNNHIYLIVAYPYYQEALATTDQMISTFKFTK